VSVFQQVELGGEGSGYRGMPDTTPSAWNSRAHTCHSRMYAGSLSSKRPPKCDKSVVDREAVLR
jgi:hypothetical protein